MQPYESGKIPALPKDDYVVPNDVTEVDLLKQVIKYQEKQIEQLNYQLHRQEESITTEKENYDTLNQDLVEVKEKLDTLIESTTTGDTTLSDTNTQIITKLDNVVSGLDQAKTVMVEAGWLIVLAVVLSAAIKLFYDNILKW